MLASYDDVAWVIVAALCQWHKMIDVVFFRAPLATPPTAPPLDITLTLHVLGGMCSSVAALTCSVTMAVSAQLIRVRLPIGRIAYGLLRAMLSNPGCVISRRLVAVLSSTLGAVLGRVDCAILAVLSAPDCVVCRKIIMVSSTIRPLGNRFARPTVYIQTVLSSCLLTKLASIFPFSTFAAPFLIFFHISLRQTVLSYRYYSDFDTIRQAFLRLIAFGSFRTAVSLMCIYLSIVKVP
jgi:hypothetical protein